MKPDCSVAGSRTAEYEKLLPKSSHLKADIARRCFRQPVHGCSARSGVGGEAGRLRVWSSIFRPSAPLRYLSEDLCVRPAHRGKGIGKRTAGGSRQQCVTNGWSQLQWAVLMEHAVDRILQIARRGLDDEWTGCGSAVGAPALPREGFDGVVLNCRGRRQWRDWFCGTIPWRLKADQQRFKAMTMGKPVVMGRKTFMSLRGRFPDAPISSSPAMPVSQPGGRLLRRRSPMPARRDRRRACGRLATKSPLSRCQIYAQWMDLAGPPGSYRGSRRPRRYSPCTIDPAAWKGCARWKFGPVRTTAPTIPMYISPKKVA